MPSPHRRAVPGGCDAERDLRLIGEETDKVGAVRQLRMVSGAAQGNQLDLGERRQRAA